MWTIGLLGGFEMLKGGISSRRWLSPWKDSTEKPAIYHCISRVVDRRFVFGDVEREHFRMFMRMQENFAGCRVLSYCIMSNHFHILLEVPPMAEGGISDEELLKRLSATNSEAFVAVVAKELTEARSQDREPWVEEIHARFTYRMHNLSEFMKTLAATIHALVQPDPPAQRHLVGGTLQECDRGKWDRGADDGGLYRLESGARRDGFRSGGVSLEQLWRGGGRRAEGKWEEGAGGLGAGLHEPSGWRLRGGEMEGCFAHLPADDGSGLGQEKRSGGIEKGGCAAADEHGGSVGSGF